MSRYIMKFGGTSMTNPEQIKRVARIIKQYYEQKHEIIVVVSAMAGTTHQLYSYLLSIVKGEKEIKKLGLMADTVLSSGEQVTAGLLAMNLENLGIPSLPLMSWQLKIHTDSKYSNATIQSIDKKLIHSMLDHNVVPVCAGFQGIFKDPIYHYNTITTLGRGGSDTTAIALSIHFHADDCFIYTDVDGVYSADPRIVTNAKKIKHLNHAEMLELSTFGAKVMDTKAIRMASQQEIPFRVLSAFKEDRGFSSNLQYAYPSPKESNEDIIQLQQQLLQEGTIVSKHSMHNETFHAIMYLRDQIFLTCRVKAQDRKILNYIIHDFGSSLDMVQHTQDSSFIHLKCVMKKSQMYSIEEFIKKEYDTSAIFYNIQNVSKISVIGGNFDNDNIRIQKTALKKGFKLYYHHKTHNRLSYVVDDDYTELVVRSLYELFHP